MLARKKAAKKDSTARLGFGSECHNRCGDQGFVVPPSGGHETARLKPELDTYGKKIGLPMIDGGLIGGDWERIAVIINEEFVGEDATLVEFKS